MKHQICLFFLILFSLSACQNGVYEKTHDVPNGKWDRDYVMEYRVDIPKSDRNYKVSVELSYQAFIEPSAIEFQLKVFNKNKEEVHEGTYSIPLRDKDNKQLGDLAGDYAEIEELIIPKLALGEKGQYTFKITHLYKEDAFEGLNKIGLRLKKARR